MRGIAESATLGVPSHMQKGTTMVWDIWIQKEREIVIHEADKPRLGLGCFVGLKRQTVPSSLKDHLVA